MEIYQNTESKEFTIKLDTTNMLIDDPQDEREKSNNFIVELCSQITISEKMMKFFEEWLDEKNAEEYE